MTKGAEPQARDELDTLRDEIDRIDRDLHARLIERGEIIDRLIAVKARQAGASAFRPAREADMMRRLVTRHRGILPLATVESIWRIIISTFTYVQAPYTVHADVSERAARMRDSARFHFGFTVPLETHGDPGAVIAAVARAEGDLGLVGAEAADGAWWQALTPPEAPKIIARLPFVERADHAAGLPVFVVARPLREAAPQDVLLYAVAGIDGAPKPHGFISVVAAVGDALVVAVPEGITAEVVAAEIEETSGRAPRVAFIGSHAARFEIEAAAALMAQG